MTNSRRRHQAGAFLLVIGCGLLCTVQAMAQGGLVVARAVGVTGQAVLTGSAAVPTLLTPGYILSPGDRIDTRGGGRVVIDLSDGSMVVVAPESVVVLKDYRMAGSLRELFEISLGAVRVKINHFAGKPNPYRMNSPTASIAVRGTEFTVAVAAVGDTQVDVIEGLVEVTSRNDPSRSVLLEAGRGVLVQVSSLRLLGANGPPPGNRDAADDRGPNHDPRQDAQANVNQPPRNGPTGNAAGGNPPPQQGSPPAGNPPGGNAMPHRPQGDPEPHAQAPPGGNPMPHADFPEHDDGSPRSTTGAYSRYLAALTDIGQVPFVVRFNAYSESHLDSLENPAYATQFRQAEGRLLFLPTYRGTRTLQAYQSALGPGGSLAGGYSISPELSFFAPAGRFTLGGSAAFSRVGDATTTVGASSSSNYYSGALVAARQFGNNGFGLELAALKGTGSSPAADPGGETTASDVNQTRITAGYSRRLTHSSTLGLFYRYAFIDASNRDVPLDLFASHGQDATVTGGHSNEAGLRFRGALSSRLYYGITASWLGISLRDRTSRHYGESSYAKSWAQRATLAFGLGYSLGDRTSLALDLAGGTGRISSSRIGDEIGLLLQNGINRSRFTSLHGAIQHDLSRRLFLSASLLQVWPNSSRFSDYGVGWRFARDLYAQYLYSTDYGVTSATHTLLLRWTFRKE